MPSIQIVVCMTVVSVCILPASLFLYTYVCVHVIIRYHMIQNIFRNQNKNDIITYIWKHVKWYTYQTVMDIHQRKNEILWCATVECLKSLSLFQYISCLNTFIISKINFLNTQLFYIVFLLFINISSVCNKSKFTFYFHLLCNDVPFHVNNVILNYIYFFTFKYTYIYVYISLLYVIDISLSFHKNMNISIHKAVEKFCRHNHNKGLKNYCC